jgi:hypothetical protein
VARTLGGRQRNCTGQHVWARGDVVSPVGRDEWVLRADLQQQEPEDRHLDHQEVLRESLPPLGGS